MKGAQTDAEVIASSLDRPERFEAIFNRHAVEIYRYLRRRAGDEVAEELTAETFERALRARDSYDLREVSALPWLFGIATNQLRMAQRSERRRRRAYRLSAPGAGTDASSTVEVEGRVDARARAPALRAALGVLSDDQREVLLLHAWAGLSLAEIARALSVSSVTVRTRLHRARARAADALERNEHQAAVTVARERSVR